MEQLRKPFEGVSNIVRFNWHFYLISAALIACLLGLNYWSSNQYQLLILIVAIIITTLTSLLVSFYVYDVSDLYQFKWLNQMKIKPGTNIINIHAGFDETSSLLNQRFPGSSLTVLDFYDPLLHTEVSIKRARKVYPPFKTTQSVSTSDLPLSDLYADYIFIIFSAHEIRNQQERNIFFNELKRITKSSGKIIVVEHLRNTSNFLAYNIGFFHFFSSKTWYNTFKKSGLNIHQEISINPFIKAFILTLHDI
jgi:ubiquinone/menaquinone biosynthesis C-methylase UbiE